MRKLREEDKGKLPKDSAPDLLRKDEQENATIIRQERKYELITPLFGGGVMPTKADPITAVRTTEIRGQLRFWWRAIRGGQFGNGPESIERMKQTEGRIWGTSGIMTKKKSDALAKIEAFSSQVQIVIKEVSKGLETRYSELGDLQYAGFPLQKGNKSVLSDVTFTLHISYPRQIKFVDEQGEERVLNNVEAEVNAALWAWETFGGLGARTRRGFGAIRCTSNVDEAANVFASNVISAKELRVELFNQLRVHLAGGDWPKDVPHLSENLSCYRVTRIERRDRKSVV